MGETQRPNILLIMTDQHRADHLGCYGNRIVRTPNIDALAARGTAFDRFYTATPVCMPNRATLMTGRMPTLHGVRHNGIPLDLEATTFTELLSAGGYATALIGKCHLQSISGKPIVQGLPEPREGLRPPPERLAEARHALHPPAAYDQELPKSWDDEAFDLALPFYGFDHVRIAIGHADQMHGHYRRWLAERVERPQDLIGPDNALSTDSAAPQAWHTRLPEELYPTSFVAEETIGYLRDHASRGGTRPFFLQCSFPDPHHPFTPPGRYWDMYRPDEVELPATFGHLPERHPPHLAAMMEARRSGRANPGGHTAFAAQEDEVRAATALTYGSITMIDDAVGRVLGELRRLGLDRNTVVIFTADHGDFMGAHGLMLKAALHYDALIRVPCIWTEPAGDGGGRRSDALCGTIDLPTSILARAGLAPFNGMQGLDLQDLAAGRASRSAILVEERPRRAYMGFPPNFEVRTLVTAGHRLSIYSGVAWGELYDFASDPGECTNLWDDAGSAGLRAALTEQLVREMMDLSERSPLARGHGP